MPWVNDIDVTNPAGTDQVKDGAGVIRTLKAAILERLDTIFADFAAGDPLVWLAMPGLSGAGAPVSGGGGTGAGTTAYPGIHYFDTTNKIEYVNINTKASPTWAPIVLGDSI